MVITHIIRIHPDPANIMPELIYMGIFIQNKSPADCRTFF